MTLHLNGNILKASWLVGILLTLVGTLAYMGWASNERRVTSLEDWRIEHEKLVAIEMRNMIRQLSTIEEQIRWIRSEMESLRKEKERAIKE